MACLITITDVNGSPPGGNPTSIRVTGTAVDCSDVEVRLRCQGNEIQTTAHVTGGQWTAIFDQTNNLRVAECRCNGAVHVVANCKGDAACRAEFRGELQCGDRPPPGNCPPITNPQAVVGPCDANGNVTVSFSANASPGAGAPPFIVAWEVAPGTTVGTTTVAAANTAVTGSYPYPGDGTTHTVQVVVVYPPGCAPIPVTFTLPNCAEPQCPTVGWRQPVFSDCNAQGRRTVTLAADITPLGGNVTAQLTDNVNPGVLDSETSNAMFVLSATRDYTPGTYTATITTDQCGATTSEFTVEGCPGTEGCPQVDIQVGPESECASGQRSVTITATVTPQPGSPVSAKLKHGATVLDEKFGQTAPFTLNKTQPFASGPHSVSVDIEAPVGCGPTQKDFGVGACSPPRDPPVEPPVDPPDDGGGWGCIIGRWVIALLFGLAFFLLFVWICFPPAGTPVLVAAGVAFALAAILLALWLALCATACDFLILLWQVALIVGIAAIYMSGCCPWLLWIGLGLLVLAAILFIVWIAECKPSECEWMRELTAAFAIGAATALDLLGNITPCAVSIIPTIVGIVTAILVAVTLAACVASARSGPGGSASAASSGTKSSAQALRGSARRGLATRSATRGLARAGGGCGCWGLKLIRRG